MRANFKAFWKEKEKNLTRDRFIIPSYFIWLIIKDEEF